MKKFGSHLGLAALISFSVIAPAQAATAASSAAMMNAMANAPVAPAANNGAIPGMGIIPVNPVAGANGNQGQQGNASTGITPLQQEIMNLESQLAELQIQINQANLRVYLLAEYGQMGTLVDYENAVQVLQNLQEDYQVINTHLEELQHSPAQPH